MNRKESGSSLACFAECPMKHQLKYVERLESMNYATALGFGTFVHLLNELNFGFTVNPHDTVQECVAKYPDSRDDIRTDYDRALGVMLEHKAYWDGYQGEMGNEWLRMELMEYEWAAPLQKGLVEFGTHVGKGDGYLHHRKYDKHFYYELKTSSVRDREQYLANLEHNAQIYSNVLALQCMEKPVDGVVYDIIWKPAIRQKATETEQEFNARWVSEYRDNPSKYFQRVFVFFDGVQVDRYRDELFMRMAQVDRSYQMKEIYRQPAACSGKYGKPCEFVEVCWDRNGEEFKRGFRTRTVKFPELTEANKGEDNEDTQD